MINRIKDIKLYLGAMSLNSVDSFLELDEVYKCQIGLISSRRQIDFLGGYVNSWTTKEFSEYVRKRDDNLVLCRDHGGPEQGSLVDDGWESLDDDMGYFDIIHIDPWKKYKKILDGSEFTVQAIQRLSQKNENCFFEVGTEEAIRKFSVDDLSIFLKYLKDNLGGSEFKRIVYCVIQSGVGLDLVNQKNTGVFDEEIFRSMLAVCEGYNLLSKEHNADYLTPIELKKRFDLGLSSANIAPEIGQIETKVYLEQLDNDALEDVYKLCLDSKKWKKWVSSDFDISKKEKLIQVCCHYIFSHDEFLKTSDETRKIILERIQGKVVKILKANER